MILEAAILDVVSGKEKEFESAFAKASPIIASMNGYISHQLQHCLEAPNRFLLLVQWETLEAHTIGFRGSAEYQEWRKLLHHFYDPFPVVQHYELSFSNPA
ncbi:MAG: antibiotic biosynthesis monooxygenase [Anaerolineales bacterium]|nr:antibiotic biosynthesis monooxygenase [Anaerolineales bacterium]